MFFSRSRSSDGLMLIPRGATHVNLWKKGLGPQEANAVAEALRNNATLTRLNLGENQLGEQGGRAVAESLSHNDTLTFLNLSYNRLGEQAGKAIAEALRSSTALATLNLTDNQLGEQGGKAIAEALLQNATLTSLDLGYNQLGKHAGKAMVKALYHNTTLTRLDLYGNTMPQDLLQKIDGLLVRTAPQTKKKDKAVDKQMLREEQPSIPKREEEEEEEAEEEEGQRERKQQQQWHGEVVGKALAELRALRLSRQTSFGGHANTRSVVQMVLNSIRTNTPQEEETKIVTEAMLVAQRSLEELQGSIKESKSWPDNDLLERRDKARRKLVEAVQRADEAWKKHDMMAMQERCMHLIQALREVLPPEHTKIKREERKDSTIEKEREKEDRIACAMNALRRFDEWKERLAMEQKKVEEETERQAQRVSQAFQRVASAFTNTASTTPEEELLKDNHVVALTDAIHNEKRFLNRQAAHPPLDDLYDGVQHLVELLQTMCRQYHEERAVISALLRQGEQIVDSPPNEKRLKELRRSSKKALQQIRYAQGDIEAAEDDEEKLEAERMLSKAKTKWKEQLIAMEREALQLVSMSNTHFPELRFKLEELGLGIVDVMAVDCPYRRLEHYDHVQVLSSAGRHCVMRAEFQGKPCVLKEFDLSFSADRQHFLRELKRLRALHHEHIVRVEGAFVHEEKGRTKGWIQMPFYTGGNLCEWLKSGRGGDRSEAEKQRAGRGVLLALQHIHSQGIIHRDVKPQNIFIEEAHSRMVTDGEEEEDEQHSPYQQAILGDFDISSNATTAATIASTAMTTDGGAGGTWQYMAPELCSGDVGPEADMFAWGLVMFDLHFAAAALRAQAQGKEVDGDEEGRETQLPPGSRPTLMEMVKGKEIIIPAHPNHQLQDLLQQVLQLDPRKRPTASQCLSHPYLWSPLVEHRVAVRDRRQCLVCMQDKWLDEGLECYSPRQLHPHQRHFVCGGCMNDWVLSLLDMPPAELAERGRHVPCLVTGCASLPFSMEQVMAHLADVGRKALLEVCSKAIEFTNHQAFQQRLQEERQQWERESTVQRHCRRIVEDILTLQCPRCHQAFVDFDGCFALKCSRCNASFCGWCLQDCGKNAHPHVKMCASNNNRGGGGRGYHGSFAQFEEAQRRRREKRVREYLQSLGREEREQVMVTLKQELEDLNLHKI